MNRNRRRHSPRWAFLRGLDIGVDGDPYLDRLRIIQSPAFNLYLHHIHRPDRERDPHDHPWWFMSFVLCGYYDETVWPDKHNDQHSLIRHRGRGSLRMIRRRSSHRITKVDGSLWTLVITGPHKGGWGFWRSGEFTYWEDYKYA